MKLEELIKLTHSILDQDRLTAFEELFEYNSPLVESAFIKALGDSDELVRCTAVEYIGEHNVKAVLKQLYGLLEDEDEDVRNYTKISLAQLNSIELLEWIYSNFGKLNDNEKLYCNVASYLLNSDSSIASVTKFLMNSDYHLRCSVANLLSEFSKEPDVEKVLSDLNRALETETTRAAKSSIEKAIVSLSE